MENLKLVEALKAHKEIKINYITDTQTKVLTHLEKSERAYLERTKQEATTNSLNANKEKEQLSNIAEVVSSILGKEQIIKEDLEYLYSIIIQKLERCVEVGYQLVGTEFIECLVAYRKHLGRDGVVKLDETIKSYILKTINGYAKRAITDGNSYRIRVCEIIKMCKDGSFGKKMQKVPLRELTEAYNSYTMTFYETKGNYNTLKLVPRDTVTRKYLDAYLAKTAGATAN